MHLESKHIFAIKCYLHGEGGANQGVIMIPRATNKGEKEDSG